MSKKGRHEEHEHENEERWLISYADFITLLMALFIVMYAMSSADAGRFQKLAVSLSGAFNVPSRSPIDLPSLPGRTGDTLAPVIKDRPTPPEGAKVPEPNAPESLNTLVELENKLGGTQQGNPAATEAEKQAAMQAAQQQNAQQKDANNPAQMAKANTEGELSDAVLDQARAQMAARDRQRLEQIKTQIDALLEQTGLAGQASVNISASGRVLNVRLPENLLFGSGSADLGPEAANVLDKMGLIIDKSGQNVRIEGHTDNIPVRSGRFASNWDLATARATRVLMYLQQTNGIPASRLSAAGYGEHRPLAPNDTPEGRARNRRVEFVITAEDLAM